MATYADSLLMRKITKLSQELKSLKTPQNYLIGDSKGYECQPLRVQSILASTETYDGVTYYNWQLRVRLRFVGNNINRRVLATLRSQFYDKNGNRTYVGSPYEGEYYEKILQESAKPYAFPGSNPNVFYLDSLTYLITTTSGSSNYYADFYVIANDTGVLFLESRV